MTEKELKRTVVALKFFFLVPGILMLSVGLFWAWQGMQAKEWHKVPGVIQNIEEKSSSSRGGIVTGVRVRYSYEYSGAVYEASRICFGMTNIKVLEEFEYLSATNQVSVWVNPKEPDQSVLIPGINSSAIFLIVFGSLVSSFALFVFRPKYAGWPAATQSSPA